MGPFRCPEARGSGFHGIFVRVTPVRPQLVLPVGERYRPFMDDATDGAWKALFLLYPPLCLHARRETQ